MTKLNPAGSAIVYSTFLGGSGADHVNSIAVDGAGNAYVTGNTTSTTFPGVSGSSIQPAPGYLWFFSSSNVEAVVKVLDGCGISGGRYWVFAGGLTNVNVVLSVTDTQTGAMRIYTNPPNTAFQPIQDTSAFACP